MNTTKLENVTLAGGCFWCMESAFSQIEGIHSLRVGYTGGHLAHPTYYEVCQGSTGHVEALEIMYDPKAITFLQILDIFWRHIDPFDFGGQFADRGSQYVTKILVHNDEQRRLAEMSKAEVQALFEKPIATQIENASIFYVAEEEHQGYCHKKPAHFKAYQQSHEKVLREIWEEKGRNKKHIKERLTPLQYHVTQEEGTEAPFQNLYWDNKKAGIYVDLLTGQPLFLSADKYDSGTGWPSFTRPLSSSSVATQTDWKLGVPRSEVKSASSGCHLGHVFPDGPAPTGLRYCLNSAALRFIPKEKMREEGYGDYLNLL